MGDARERSGKFLAGEGENWKGNALLGEREGRVTFWWGKLKGYTVMRGKAGKDNPPVREARS